MKVIGFVIVALLGVTYAFPPPLPSNDDGKIHIPNKCSDVLAVKVCENLVAIAKRLRLNADVVTKAVVDAVKQGKTSSIEIYQASKDFLKKEVLSKKCEDFTAAETCDKLRKVAAMLKLKSSKVEEMVVDIVAEGSVQAKEIYAKAMEYYKKEIATKTCQDFLSQNNCMRLNLVRSILKGGAIQLEEAIKEAYLEYLGDAQLMVKKVIDVMKDYAMNTKCEDLLNGNLCESLRRYASATRVKFPVLMRTAIDLLVKGYDVSKSLVTKVYQLVDHMYDCTDVFDQSSCDRIYRYASKVGVAKEKVEEFLKKYIPIAVEKGKDAYKDVAEFSKQAFAFLKNWVCSNTILCDDDSQSDEMVAFADQVGFFDMDLIKQKVLEYINIKYPGLEDRVKAKVMSIFNGANSIAQLIKNAINEIVFIGGDAAQKIKKILQDLIDNVKSIVKSITSSSDEADHSMVRRSVDFDQLKQKLKKFIEEKFPALQANIKQKIMTAIEKAKSKTGIVVQLVKEFLLEKSPAVIKLVKELISKIREFVKTY